MSKYHAPALDKGLDILEFLSKHTTAQSQAEIAVGLNRSPNEIYRMLICLDQRGFIRKDQVSSRFSLTLKLYQLSHRHSPIEALRKAAHYPMQLLSERTSQSCHLSILSQGQVMVISQNLSPRPISLSIQEGNLFPISSISSGRIMLSMLENDERSRLLSADLFYQELSQRKQKQLLKEIEAIEKQGYIIRESETTRGVTDYVLPLGSSEIEFIGALAVTKLSGMITDPKTSDRIIKEIKKTVDTIHQDLGVDS